LDGLDQLNLRGNRIRDMDEQVLYVLNTMKVVRHLDFRENPVIKDYTSLQKYRDQIIIASRSVE